MKDKILALIKSIEKEKDIIANHRDILRKIEIELTDLIESFDRGIESINNGLIDIQIGIDSLSEQI